MTTPVDVNQAFHTERLAQIDYARSAPERAAQAEADRKTAWDERLASGKLIPLGGNRYRVQDPDSFDNGEILTGYMQRQANGELVQVILPEHGLATTPEGKIAVYAAVPMWHELGNVSAIPGGITDIDTVLELAGLNWEVQATPVEYTHDGVTRVVPDKWVTKRKDTGDPLGIIGKVYQNGGIVQNRAAFEFLEDLTGTYGVAWESAGALTGFSKVFISMRLPESIVIDAEGINDEIIPFIVAINSHDGGSSFQVVVTPWRPVCGNTERFAVRDAHTSWKTRHSTNTTQRLAEARRTLGLSLKYFDNFAKEEELLAQANLEIDELRKVIDGVWKPEPGETDAKTKKRTHRSNHIVSLFEANAELLGRTAYAGERAFTEFLDHHVAVQPRGLLKGKFAAARATRVLEGTQDEKKSQAHRALLTLVNR